MITRSDTDSEKEETEIPATNFSIFTWGSKPIPTGLTYVDHNVDYSGQTARKRK